MGNSKNSDGQAMPSQGRFTVDALTQILVNDLAVAPPLYVAYSGGLDSHVLLHALARLRERFAWSVHAVHVDHQLQPASSEWSRHCLAVSAELGIPCYVERVTVDGIGEHGLEDAARRARYQAFARLLPTGATLMLAHHQDDQAETVLLQLLRGAGVHGLAGMPSDARFAAGRIVRPLLPFRRAALRAYAEANRLQWIDDASNRDTRMARNFLRHELWPLLERRWPTAIENLARSARHQADAATLLDEQAQVDLRVVAAAERELAVTKLRHLSRARQANVIRYWIRRAGLKMPSETVLHQILHYVEHDTETRHAIIHWSAADVRRYRDRLVLAPPVADRPSEWQEAWAPDEVLDLPGSQWRLRAQPAIGRGISRARIDGNVVRVRLRQGGERCVLRGHHRKLKKLLQEAGIPPWERTRIPLIYVGDDLAAVGDQWVSDPYVAQANEPGLVIVIEPR
jgi:tRNA(Ile)-lysidine synthase